MVGVRFIHLCRVIDFFAYPMTTGMEKKASVVSSPTEACWAG